MLNKQWQEDLHKSKPDVKVAACHYEPQEQVEI